MVNPVFRKSKEDDPRNCRPVSLTSIFGKGMEQLILKNTVKHIRDKDIIKSSHHSFSKGKACFTNLTELLR